MPKAYQGASTRTYRKLYGYKNLIAWQKADDLAAQVHEVTVHWEPGYYRLSDQMRSAAVSATSNIAEGYCRVSLGDYIRFCEIARGSLGELGSQTTTFRPVTEDSVFLQVSAIPRMLNKTAIGAVLFVTWKSTESQIQMCLRFDLRTD